MRIRIGPANRLNEPNQYVSGTRCSIAGKTCLIIALYCISSRLAVSGYPRILLPNVQYGQATGVLHNRLLADSAKDPPRPHVNNPSTGRPMTEKYFQF